MVGKRVGSGIVDAVNACLEQIAQRQGQINAFSFLRPRAEIIAEAAAAEERWRLGAWVKKSCYFCLASHHKGFQRKLLIIVLLLFVWLFTMNA